MKDNSTITIGELLDRLDGYGIIFTDEELVEEELKYMGFELDTIISNGDPVW